MTDRRIEEPRKAGPDAALVIVGAIAVLAGVRWLARLGRPVLALIAAAIVVVLFFVWAVRPRRQLPRHRVRFMRLRARLRLHPGPGHATVFELWLRWGRLAAARRPGHGDPPCPAAVRDGRVQGRRGGLLGRGDRAVAADAAARRGASAQHDGIGALLGAVPVPRGVPACPARRGRGSRAVGHTDPRPDDLHGDQDHRHHPVHGRREPGVHARPGAARGRHSRARRVQPGRLRP
jgi:ABC-type nickel/cobalt efflux system permease component RcnA